MSESYTKVSRSTVILEISIFIRFCMANGQALPVQFICHTEPYKNYNFQIDGASRYFGVWLWQLVHLLILVCSFQWYVLFSCLTKHYRSCPIRDKGLFRKSLIVHEAVLVSEKPSGPTNLNSGLMNQSPSKFQPGGATNASIGSFNCQSKVKWIVTEIITIHLHTYSDFLTLKHHESAPRQVTHKLPGINWLSSSFHWLRFRSDLTYFIIWLTVRELWLVSSTGP